MATVDLKIPAFEHTPEEDITKITTTLRSSFRAGKTRDLQWRLVQLRKLYWALKDYTPAIVNALAKDMRKCKHETMLTEVGWVLNECLYMIKNLEEFARDEPAPDVPLTFIMMKPRVRKEPLGMVLVIGAYNFPIQLTLAPFVGAIAAGCTAVLKPSEGSPHTAMVLRNLFAAALDPSCFAVVNGAVPETQALLDIKWDKICYTGGTHVGKIIARKAAETLTPIVLEMGGLNPAFITRNADIKLAARRLAWAKVLNAGQICLSQNYILADRAIVPDLIKGFQAAFRSFFPSGPKNSPDFSRIINERHFARIKTMLDSTAGQIVIGGETDEKQLYIEPTVVLVQSADDSMVVEESFGPVFAILPYDSLDEAINLAVDLYQSPLALFAFGNNDETKKIIENVPSGGATINDAFTHASIPTLPFGGVGDSGTGAYRGRASFECFSHRRSLATVPSWVDKFLRVRYMPYSPRELAKLQRMNTLKPDFDRTGKQVKGLRYWLGMMLALGASSVKEALVRWTLAIVGLLFAKRRGLLEGVWGGGFGR